MKTYEYLRAVMSLTEYDGEVSVKLLANADTDLHGGLRTLRYMGAQGWLLVQSEPTGKVLMPGVKEYDVIFAREVQPGGYSE